MAFAVAAVGKPRNGGFETGDLTGWKTKGVDGFDGSPAPSLWQAYSDPIARGAGVLAPFPAPPKGRFGAAADFGPRPGLDILHRVLRLNPNRINKLSLLRAWRTEEPFNRRGHLGCTFTDPRHMEFRIDILKRRAPLTSLLRRHVLATLFRTSAATPPRRGFHRSVYNLTARGITNRHVRLRVVACNNVDADLVVGIDKVKQSTKRP